MFERIGKGLTVSASDSGRKDHMPRFIMNRTWTFILALVLGLGSLVAIVAHPSYAGETLTGKVSEGGLAGHGGGTFVPPPGYGDPDVPITAAKPTAMSPGTPVRSGTSGSQAVGDSRATSSALVWRLQVVARVLRGFYLLW
jgi:hypothetical protein